MRLPTLILLLAFADGAAGAEPPKAAPPKPAAPPRSGAPAPPPLPENYEPPDLPGADRGALEPEITIKSRGNEIHEEYRANGRLYMVKVKPAKGPPYYLIYDERGNFRRSDLEPDVVVPSWVIKRF